MPPRSGGYAQKTTLVGIRVSDDEDPKGIIHIHNSQFTIHNYPTNPIATRYFSELSAREAAGFTFITLRNLCFNTCNNPASAPPAKTFATKNSVLL